MQVKINVYTKDMLYIDTSTDEEYEFNIHGSMCESPFGVIRRGKVLATDGMVVKWVLVSKGSQGMYFT